MRLPFAAILALLIPLLSSRANAEDGADDVPAGVSADAPAVEAPEGLWSWIDRMEGEIPTREAEEGIAESQAERQAERAFIGGFGGIDVPLDFYKDPGKLLSKDPLFLDQVDQSEFDIPVEVNGWVEKWVRYFTGSGRKYYERWLGRSTRYRPMMYKELERQGLPRDLVYLSMIESGYNAHAYSHADAAGLWQFIPSTGKMYDLRIDWWVDDRRDPYRSTVAAARFLKELHQMFDGNWYLAWASYNGGPGRLKRASRDAGTTNFWTLADGSYLHTETDNYVPKIIAAAIIGKHPERYGFTNIQYQEELRYEEVKVQGVVELATLARCANLDLEAFQTLNPALRRHATPAEGHIVRIPVGSTESFLAKLADVPPPPQVVYVRHTVKKGETLGAISQRYGVSVAELQRSNKLRSANHIYVGMVLVVGTKQVPSTGGGGGVVASAVREADSAPAPIPNKTLGTTPKGTPTAGSAQVTRATPAATSSAGSASSSSGSSSSSGGSSASSAPKAKPTTYTVRSGDTLSEIADRYNVSVSQLQAWNGLRGSTIVVGQNLKVSAGSSGGSAATAAAKPASVRHTVKKGETLSGIADRYNVSTADLQRWNGIRNASEIQVGQVLTVNGASGGGGSSAPAFTNYTVKSGDSLTVIAQRHGVTVDQLKSWNGLSSSVIHPGQTLKIKRG